MEVKKYNPFVVKPKPKTTDSTRKRSLKTKPKTKLDAKGLWRSIGETGSRMDGVLSQENKKKLDIIYAKGFVKKCKK